MKYIGFTALFACVVTVSCKGESAEAPPEGSGAGSGASSSAGSAAVPAASAKPAPRPKKPSVRPKLTPWRPLIGEAGRAEMAIRGLFIDFGTADQHKYTRGGWRTGWGDNQQSGDVSLAQVPSKKTLLDVLTHEPFSEVVVRARSAAPGQKITLYVDDKAVGSASLASDWGLARVPIRQPVAPGRHTVMLRYSKSGKPSAELDWMWLSTDKGAEVPNAPGLRVLPIRVGGQPKRALIAPTPRSYSFYLQPPRDASLVVDYGSETGASFAVKVHVDGSPAKELLSARGQNYWNEAQIDLSAYADQAIRLELAVSGKSGVSGFAEPVIMVDPKSIAESPATSRTKRPKNVIVILIDTVRDDAFKVHNPKSQVKTPAYNRLAEKSTVFVNAYNNENWTKPSVATTLSSLYPSTHDTKEDGSALPAEVELVSQRFQRDGFATAGFVANGYVSKKFGFEKGWDYFRNYIRENRKSDAEYVYADALKWLKQDRDQTKPFFLYIQTIDPHVIYKVARQYTELYYKGEYKGPLGPNISAEEQRSLSSGKMKASSRDIDWLRAVYYGEITYHDEYMGKFLDDITALGVLNDTILVVTNDHGEELQDHGKFGHGHSLYGARIMSS